MPISIGFFLGTNEDWGGASRAVLNFVRLVDRTRFRPIVIVTRGGPLVDKLSDEGIDCVTWETHDFGRNPLRYASHVVSAMRFFRRSGFDLLHVNHGNIGWKPAEVIAARLLRIPVVNHLHVPFAKPSSFIRYSSMVVGVSRYVADNSETFGVPKCVIHNVSDLRRFGNGTSLRHELGYSEDDVIVAFFGQMIRVKGLEMFVDVARQIVDPRAKFIVAGPLRKTEDAYTEEEVRELVARDPRIQYLGYRSDVENLYATSDVVIMPSQWDEPCAMVLFEAAAAGKPIVATATGGTPEIVRHGETGFLVERRNVDEMTTHVRRLIDDRELRERMGARAGEVARRSLAVDPVHQFEQLFASLAHAHSASR